MKPYFTFNFPFCIIRALIKYTSTLNFNALQSSWIVYYDWRSITALIDLNAKIKTKNHTRFLINTTSLLYFERDKDTQFLLRVYDLLIGIMINNNNTIYDNNNIKNYSKCTTCFIRRLVSCGFISWLQQNSSKVLTAPIILRTIQ